MEERKFWLGFSVFPGVGPKKFALLLETFKTAKRAWNASSSDLKEAGFGNVLTNQFEEFRKTFSFDEYEKKLSEKEVSYVILKDEEYPKLLKEIKNAPFVLYTKGDKKAFQNQSSSLAVVGARNVTNYGKDVTDSFTKELVNSGYTIVSGLAMGVDAIAHRATLENDGITIAVLGCGVDCCYPTINKTLYNMIIANRGLVVSEVPLGKTPSKGLFPARNRIISGLSQGVLVTEGATDSGSLITADHALSIGRKVFAVPGPITSSLSQGPYKLIQKGAKLVTNAQDVMEELGKPIPAHDKSPNDKRMRGDTKAEDAVLKLLENQGLGFDEIVRMSRLESSLVGSTLSILEIKGIIKTRETGEYIINSELRM